jgi:antirestriction protein ArdC
MEKTEKPDRIKETLNKVIDIFEKGNIPEAIKIATFPTFDVPSNKWSLCNRMLMMFAGTADARGFRQWEQVGRFVKKGEKAHYILAPKIIKKKGKDGKDDETMCVGFLTVPVFAVEQTEGEPLEYQKIKLPDFPLIEKAREWGIGVEPMPFTDCLGYYEFGKGEKIRLATTSEKTFFHELSHAAHARIKKLKTGQDKQQEIVAELSAQVLAQLVGVEVESTLGNSYSYIYSYAAAHGQDVAKACLAVVADVEKVLNLILS